MGQLHEFIRALGHWASKTPPIPEESEQGLERLQAVLLAESQLSVNYLVLIFSSCAIATFGLLSNSAAVIIGAMIVAPLMLPIRGLALGALGGNIKLTRAGFISIFVGTFCAVSLSCFLGWLVGLPTLGSEILARTQPTLLDLGIALAAGCIGAFAKVRKGLSDTLAGVAIAVALMPPVCVIGLGIAQGNRQIALGAFLLYGTNLLGITLACMVVFLLTGFVSFTRARNALLWTGLFTSLLLVPLSISFTQLLTQARLQNSLQKILSRGTVTFKKAKLLDSQINWLTRPPTATLQVVSTAPIFSNQVRLLEEFVAKQTGQYFTFVLQVNRVDEVRSSDEQ